ncbi:unnamed protein product, partial [Ectocarpus sp. 8 AP-2014]
NNLSPSSTFPKSRNNSVPTWTRANMVSRERVKHKPTTPHRQRRCSETDRAQAAATSLRQGIAHCCGQVKAPKEASTNEKEIPSEPRPLLPSLPLPPYFESEKTRNRTAPNQ